MMLSEREGEALKSLKTHLTKAEGDNLLEIRLFGSKARGDDDVYSDTDVLILLGECDWERRRVLTDLAFGCGYPFKVFFAPLILSERQFHGWKERELLIAQEIDREGIRI